MKIRIQYIYTSCSHEYGRKYGRKMMVTPRTRQKEKKTKEKKGKIETDNIIITNPIDIMTSV